jgi:multiple sugar transport system substrate-binding protein
MTARHSRRRFLGSSGLLLAGLGVPGLTSCGGGSGSAGQVSLRMFWSGSQETNRILLSVIKAFEKANSKIDIRPEYGAGGGAVDKLNTQIAGGRAPDLIVMSTSSLSDYVKRKVVFPLDEYTSSVIDLSDFDKRVVANATIDGKLYALPLGVNAPGLIYDRTLFERAGVDVPPPDWTWDDFARTANVLTTSLGNGMAGSEDAGGKKTPFELFVRQRGKELFDGPQLGFTKEDLGDWLDFWYRLRRTGGVVAPDVQALYDQMANSPLIKGKAPMLFAAADNILGAQPLIKDKLDLHLYPRGEGDAPLGFYLVSNTMFVGYARTEHKQETATAIGAMLTKPEIAKFNMVEHGMPPSSKARDLVAAELEADAKHVFDFIQNFATMAGEPPAPAPPGGSEVEDILDRTNTDVAFRRLGISAAVDRFFSEASSALKNT